MARTMAVVMFTDLVGSTELRGRLGEEAADELRRRHDQLLSQAVEANSGRVVKGLGDGVMATFAGASDAVATAVAIQQAIDRLNRSGKAAVPLAVRVGLSAGDVAFEDDDVHGTPVIEAARLCGAARGGEILASEIVRWLGGTQDASAFTPVGSLELKGLPAPVPVVRIEWSPAPVSTIPMPALLTDIGRIFVGRDDELEQLSQLWKEASAGERRVAVLAGEPGVGKTRLAAEVAMRAHDQGGTVLAGRCDEDLGVPYQPLVEALRHFVDHTPPTQLASRLGRWGGELNRLVPELGERADLPAPLRSDPETERYRLFDAAAGWLAAAAPDEGMVLVLDDLQWAAKPTLLLLRHILRSSEVRRLLVVGTYRDTELTHDHPLVDLLADLRRDGTTLRLSLSGLDDRGVVAFVERAAGQALDDDGLALAKAIHEETEGNPFFVREVLRHLAETNAIARDGERWATQVAIDQLGIPEGVRDVVGRRLARLSASANQALWVASVVGPAFDMDILRAAAGMSDDEVLAALDEAVAGRLISETLPGRFRFSHAVVRTTLYESLSGARKVTMHRLVAEALETLHGAALDNYLPALAHHWARASAPAAETGKAVDYAIRAGDRALAQLAHDEAVTYYRQALELLDVAPVSLEDQRIGLLIVLGEAERRAGDTAHRETLLRAARLAAEMGDPDALARAALANTRGMYSSSVGEVDEERVAVFEAAVDAVGHNDTPTRARLLAALGAEITFTGERDRRLRLADEALAIARRTGDVATLAHVLLQRFFAIFFPDSLGELLDNTEELLALAERLDDPVVRAQALWLRGRVLAQVGKMDEAVRNLEAAEQLTEELGQPTLRWLVGGTATARIILAGDLEEGERRARAGFELGQATGQPDAPSFLAVQLFLVRLEQDRLGELEEPFTERVVALRGLPTARAYLARLLCEIDRPDAAVEHYERLAAGNFAALPRDIAWMLGVSQCAVVATFLNDQAGARVLFEMLVPYASQIVFSNGGSLGAVAHYLAVLAATSGDFDEAQRRFAEAANTHERIGAPTWLARTRLEWARMLLSRCLPGEPGDARELLEQALATARELGLANVERRAVQLLRDCP
jgi:class 3 adenylate cyclase/tetratricopeptide (TPR) repeat protein